MSKKQIYWATGVGIIYLLLYYLPYFILGENSYIFMSDNLDSEIIFNMLSAKYFWDFNGTMPELMNVDVRAINCFSLFQLLFYSFLPPFWAYMLNDILTRALAYLGMFLVMNLIFKNKHQFISIVTAILFASISFFSVYGLTAMGIPLLAWAMWKIFKREKLVRAYLIVFTFGISSALFLSGYFILAILGTLSIYFLCKKEYRKQQIPFYIATVLLITLYTITNIKMINLMLSGYESHRDLWNDKNIKIRDGLSWNPLEYIGWMLYILFFGHIHSRSMVTIVALICSSVLLIELIIRKKTDKPSEQYEFAKLIKWLLIANIIIAVISTTLYSRPIILLFQTLGLNGFKLQRTFHLMTPIWYVAGGVALAYLYQTIKKHRSEVFTKGVIVTLACISFLFSTSVVFDWKPNESYLSNWGALVGYSSKSSPTYKQFYNSEIYSEIDKYIATNYGKQKHEYRVGSVGIYPMIAVYNDFHTVDGYVQNYSLEYWHEFRKIITSELEKDSKMDQYFNWGNKCFLFTAELGHTRYMFHKDSGKQINNLEFNIQAFNDLGGEFILSSVPIINHTANGLEVLNDGKAFENANSWYKVYLYKVI